MRSVVRSPENWPEDDFTKAADETLQRIGDAIWDARDSAPNSVDLDVECAEGVLTVALGDPWGTYVLNRQRPNRQIWLTSPVSGPKRFQWDDDTRDWRSTRGNHHLLDFLKTELHEHCEVDVSFPDQKDAKQAKST